MLLPLLPITGALLLIPLSLAFPGEVTSTNGDRVDSDIVEWKLKPGVVSTMSAQARVTDPSTRSFTAAALWLGLGALVPAALDVGLAATVLLAAVALADVLLSPAPREVTKKSAVCCPPRMTGRASAR